MIEDQYTDEQLAAITEYVDVAAPPPGMAAHLIFGTNQPAPIDIAVEQYERGLAPLIIVTGGINRHDGSVEAQEFRRLLLERGVDDSNIRQEDRSINTWQNVEFSLAHLREAAARSLPICAVCKWYHRRAIHCALTTFPQGREIYALTYDPVYSGVPVTRENWAKHPDGKQKVIREWEEVSRRVSDGTFADVQRSGGVWQ